MAGLFYFVSQKYSQNLTELNRTNSANRLKHEQEKRRARLLQAKKKLLKK